jgi:hypothetical protein
MPGGRATVPPGTWPRQEKAVDDALLLPETEMADCSDRTRLAFVQPITGPTV